MGSATVVIDEALNGTISLGEVEFQLAKFASEEDSAKAVDAVNAIFSRFSQYIYI